MSISREGKYFSRLSKYLVPCCLLIINFCFLVEACVLKSWLIEEAPKEILIKDICRATTTIKINASVSVRGTGNTSVIGSTHQYAFEVVGNDKMSVNISNIRFSRIGILKVRAGVEVSIINCTTVGIGGSIVFINPGTKNAVTHFLQVYLLTVVTLY